MIALKFLSLSLLLLLHLYYNMGSWIPVRWYYTRIVVILWFDLTKQYFSKYQQRFNVMFKNVPNSQKAPAKEISKPN